jgi:hypothetical protein
MPWYSFRSSLVVLKPVSRTYFFWCIYASNRGVAYHSSIKRVSRRHESSIGTKLLERASRGPRTTGVIDQPLAARASGKTCPLVPDAFPYYNQVYYDSCCTGIFSRMAFLDQLKGEKNSFLRLQLTAFSSHLSRATRVSSHTNAFIVFF